MNATEAGFLRLARKKSFRIFRGGWPDFFLLDGSGKAMFVEVKRGPDRLRPEQLEMLAALTAAGIRCYVWWDVRPDTLFFWSKFTDVQETTLAQAAEAERVKRARRVVARRRAAAKRAKYDPPHT